MGEISSISPRCIKALDDAGLHAFMDSKEECFVLFLSTHAGETEPDEYAHCGCTGFYYLIDDEEDSTGFYVYPKEEQYTE